MNYSTKKNKYIYISEFKIHFYKTKKYFFLYKIIILIKKNIIKNDEIIIIILITGIFKKNRWKRYIL